MAMAMHVPTSHALGSVAALPTTRKPSATVRASDQAICASDRVIVAAGVRMPSSREVRGSVARRSAEAGSTTTTATSVAGGVLEVDKDTFWPFVKSATEENKVAVLDMYTQWCGPCKLMLPKVIALSETYDDVVFCKLDCNQENKPLAKELGVKTVPTFKIFKNGEEVAEIRGAKYDDLVKAIENARL